MGTQKCIAYTRNGTGDEAALALQQKRIEEYCQQHGYEMTAVYKAARQCDEEILQDVLRVVKEQTTESDDVVRLVAVNTNRITRDLIMLPKVFETLKVEGVLIETLDREDLVRINPTADSFVNMLFEEMKEPKEEHASVPKKICEHCGQVELDSDGCTVASVYCDGKIYKRIPYGDEAFTWPHERCHDCGALQGEYHHYGCDVEECPVCGEQMIDCGCKLEFEF